MKSVQEKANYLVHIVVGVLTALLLSGYFMRHTLSALLTSLVLAYLLNPLLKYLEKRGFQRLWALVILYIFLALVLAATGFLLVPYLGQQLQHLVRGLPFYIQSLEAEMAQWQMRLSPYYTGAEGAWLLERGREWVEKTSTALSGVGYNRLTALMYAAFNLVLAPILVFFMLLYKQHCKDVVKRVIPHGHRRQMVELGQRINRSLEGFIIGMFIDSSLVALLTAFALYMLDLQFALLNGLIAGFASIVPFIGVTVAVIPAALVGYAQTGDVLMIGKIGLIYFIINVIIEGNLIKPLVMRHTLRLNPLAVIFAVMAMGEIMGFWGIVLAIPLAAVIKICAAEIKNKEAA